MIGPEHYSEAQKLLAKALDPSTPVETATWQIAAAQVHATLAHAAATAVGNEAKSSWLRVAWKNFVPGGAS